MPPDLPPPLPDPCRPSAVWTARLGDGPRYAALATVLADAIAARHWPVGSLLPPEDTLAQTFSVSRATVREALRRLRELGLAAAARGVGTRVIAERPRSNYVLAARSVADIMGYADRTRLEIMARRTVRATQALAEQLGCAPGTRWRHVSGIRRSAPDGRAISCVELYVAIAFQDIADSEDLVTTPAYRLIAQRRGTAVAEILQDIAAVALLPAQAAVLGSEAGAPGLHIRRRFFSADGALLEATLNVHADASRFAYALRLGNQVAL